MEGERKLGKGPDGGITLFHHAQGASAVVLWEFSLERHKQMSTHPRAGEGTLVPKSSYENQWTFQVYLQERVMGCF